MRRAFRFGVCSIFYFILTINCATAFAVDLKIDTIYGRDSRRDIYEIVNPIHKEAVLTTVMLVESKFVKRLEKGIFEVRGPTYGESENLCSEEKFYNQPAAGFCSGVLIAEDLILTAGHCITELTCAATTFVFDYNYGVAGQDDILLGEDQVRRCRKVVKQRVNKQGMDYAIVKLNKPVVDRDPAVLAEEGKGHAGMCSEDAAAGGVFAIGHPMGLPAKFASGSVRFEDELSYVTNLDTFSGNSGSPVFEASTGNLIGILTEGDEDFEYDDKGECYRSRRCSDNDCEGETVFKLSALPGLLKAAPWALPMATH